jgi:hypothetical protein
MTELTADDYDSPWKEAIEHYFPEFMAFYFPDAAVQIDWSQGYTFLDQELRAVVQDAELGKRFVDKLVQLKLHSGADKWVYIHLEVQGQPQKNFAKRMFTYNYRIFDRYDQPVASLAVLADENPHWKPDHYGFEILGCEHFLKFPIAKLTDYHERLEELKASDNAFGYITAAHILTQQTRGQVQQRREAKSRLVRLLYERGWDKQRIIDLFLVIDSLLKLPDWLERQIWQEITEIEERHQMRYVSSVERIGIEKGLLQGREEGRQEGHHEGLLEADQNTLRRLLIRRFKITMPDWVEQRITHASQQELEQWLDNIIEAETIEAVLGLEDSAH